MKSGPEDYAEDDRLWDEQAQVKKKVIATMHETASGEEVEHIRDDVEMIAAHRRALECYCILRREEMRVADITGKTLSLEGGPGVLPKKKEKAILLGLCGYWNPLVAMKVIAILMDNITSTFNLPSAVESPTETVNTSSHKESTKKTQPSKLVGMKSNHMAEDTSMALPADYEVANTEYEVRTKRLTQLSKAEKTLKRLQSEGKGDADQAKKLKTDLVKIRSNFDSKRLLCSKSLSQLPELCLFWSPFIFPF